MNEDRTENVNTELPPHSPCLENDLMQSVPGCIGHEKVVFSSEFRALDTPIAGRPFRTDQVCHLDGRTVDPLSDVRLPVCQPQEVHFPVVDPKMSPRGSRVKPDLHKVPELLTKQPKPLRLNGSRIFRRLRKKSRSKCLDNENDTIQNVSNEYVCMNNTINNDNGIANSDLHDDVPSLVSDMNVMSLRPKGCDINIMSFDVDEYRRLHEEYGPITLEAQATPYNNLCKSFCTEDNPFTSLAIKGETMFICPASAQQVMPMLEYFENARSQSPLDTRAIIVLPILQRKMNKLWKVVENNN